MKIMLYIASLAVLVVAVVLVLAGAKTFVPKQGAFPATSTIDVLSPAPGAAISSPLSVSGEAPSSWYFEAVFPVVVVDWDGKMIGTGQARAQTDWMAAGMIPFTGTIEFAKPPDAGPQSARGSVIFKNDNPSGDPARDKAVEIPVTFK